MVYGGLNSANLMSAITYLPSSQMNLVSKEDAAFPIMFRHFNPLYTNGFFLLV